MLLPQILLPTDSVEKRTANQYEIGFYMKRCRLGTGSLPDLLILLVLIA